MNVCSAVNGDGRKSQDRPHEHGVRVDGGRVEPPIDVAGQRAVDQRHRASRPRDESGSTRVHLEDEDGRRIALSVEDESAGSCRDLERGRGRAVDACSESGAAELGRHLGHRCSTGGVRVGGGQVVLGLRQQAGVRQPARERAGSIDGVDRPGHLLARQAGDGGARRRAQSDISCDRGSRNIGDCRAGKNRERRAGSERHRRLRGRGGARESQRHQHGEQQQAARRYGARTCRTRPVLVRLHLRSLPQTAAPTKRQVGQLAPTHAAEGGTLRDTYQWLATAVPVIEGPLIQVSGTNLERRNPSNGGIRS